MSELTRGDGEQPPEKSQSATQIWLVSLVVFIALPTLVVLGIKYLFGF